MNKLLFAKILVLLIALAMIISVMTQLTPEKVSKSLEAIGAAPGTAEAPGLQPFTRAVRPGEVAFNLCRNRVHAVIWPDGKKVEELRQGLKLTWRAFDPEPRELPYLGVEKWFSHHCQINVAMETSVDQAGQESGYRTYLTLEFIDGSKDEISRSENGVFRHGTTLFRSEDLELAVAELVGIAQFQATGP